MLKFNLFIFNFDLVEVQVRSALFLLLVVGIPTNVPIMIKGKPSQKFCELYRVKSSPVNASVLSCPVRTPGERTYLFIGTLERESKLLCGISRPRPCDLNINGQ